MSDLEQWIVEWCGDFTAHIEIRQGGGEWYAVVIVQDNRRDVSWMVFETSLQLSIQDSLDALVEEYQRWKKE